MNCKFLIFSCLFFLVFSAEAGRLRIKNIIITGNKMVSTEAVRSKIVSKKFYQRRQVRKNVQRLFATGWFKNIEVQLKKNSSGRVTLIYKVEEQPVVEKIIYKGHKKLKQKDLEEVFLFSEYEFLNHKKIQQSLQALKKQYEEKGYYLAELSYDVKPTSVSDKVQVVVNIQENQKVKVRKIQFIGNHSVSSEELKNFMSTRTAGLFSFLSGSGAYSAEVLEKDLNNIKYIYLDKGYWQIYIDKPQVLLSSDQQDIVITISLKEGDQYKAGSIHFSGDLIFSTEYLKEGLETKEAEVFSYGKLQRDIKRIETKYGDKGYAFVNVIPRFLSSREEKNVTHILFEIQKGKEVSIRRIHISGNDYTRDKVIRREIRVFEGDLYSSTKKNRSAENIQRLGFFEDVKILPSTLTKKEDQVDLDVSVKERENTGILEGGIGYNGYMGFEIRGKIHKMNLFGKGYNVGLDLDLNAMRQHISLNFTNPYFLDSRWQLGGEFYLDYWDDTPRGLIADCPDYQQVEEKYKDTAPARSSWNRFWSWLAGAEPSALYQQKEKELLEAKRKCSFSLPSAGYRGFAEQKASAGWTLGRALTDHLKVLLYYRWEKIKLFNTIDDELFPVQEAGGFRDPLSVIIEYDKRNDRIFPTDGLYSRGSIAYNGPLGKFDYFTFSGNFRWYKKLFWEFIFRMNTQYSRHFTWGEESSVPFDRLFLLGGINSLRGFDYFSIGPRKHSRQIFETAQKINETAGRQIDAKLASSRVFGGHQELYTNLEIQFPILKAMRLSGVVFMDAGSAFDDFSSVEWRANWGVGLRVFTPMGPIRVEMGFPFRPKPEWGEKKSNFNFTMGFAF